MQIQFSLCANNMIKIGSISVMYTPAILFALIMWPHFSCFSFFCFSLTIHLHTLAVASQTIILMALTKWRLNPVPVTLFLLRGTQESPVHTADPGLTDWYRGHLSPKFSDSKIICGDKTFLVHRMVMSANSTFFEAACYGEFKVWHPVLFECICSWWTCRRHLSR